MSAADGPMRDFMRALEASGFRTCSIQTGEQHMELRLPVAPAPATVAAPPPATGAEQSDETAPVGESPLRTLRSPRVGHFYPRAGADGKPRFAPGAVLEMGEVFATVEAMQLKYELRAEHSGVVEEYLADEGEAVEYGQPLVLLRPEGAGQAGAAKGAAPVAERDGA